MLRKLQSFEASINGIGVSVDKHGVQLGSIESPAERFFREHKTELIIAGSVLGVILLVVLVLAIVKKYCKDSSHITMMAPFHSWYGGGGQPAPPTTTIVMPQPVPSYQMPSYPPQDSPQELQPLQPKY